MSNPNDNIQAERAFIDQYVDSYGCIYQDLLHDADRDLLRAAASAGLTLVNGTWNPYKGGEVASNPSLSVMGVNIDSGLAPDRKAHPRQIFALLKSDARGTAVLTYIPLYHDAIRQAGGLISFFVRPTHAGASK